MPPQRCNAAMRRVGQRQELPLRALTFSAVRCRLTPGRLSPQMIKFFARIFGSNQHGISLRMGKQLFGTDGIRGIPGEYPLDDATLERVGLALGMHLRGAGKRRSRAF